MPNLSGSSSFYLIAAASATGTTRARVSGSSTFWLSAEVTVRRAFLRGSSSFSLTSTVSAAKTTQAKPKETVTRVQVSGEFIGGDTAISLLRLATQIYNIWGMEVKTANDISFARSRVIEIVNAALQIVYSRAKTLDFFSRTPGSLTFASAESSKVMPSSMQSLVGHVRTVTADLRAAASREEFQAWSTIYFDGATTLAPRVYWLEQKAAAQGVDSAECVMHIAPTPSEETVLLFDYAAEAPRFRDHDLQSGTRLQIPHAYAETLVLPICKYMASVDNLFRGDQALRQAINTDYQRAMQQLGMVTPEPAPTQRTRREAAAA